MGYENFNTETRRRAGDGVAASGMPSCNQVGAAAIKKDKEPSDVEELFKARQRVDRQGAEMMSTASVAFLLKLAAGEGKWTSMKVLRPFLASMKISEDDVLPLVQRGWVGQRGSRSAAPMLQITDEGNAVVRAMVLWLEGGAA